MKRKIIISAVCAAAAAVLLCTAVYVHSFYYDRPEDDLKKAMDAVVNHDSGTASLYLDYDSFYRTGTDEKLYSSLMKNFSYSIESIQRNGSKAEAVLTVNNRDMEQIYGNFVTDACDRVFANAALDKDKRKSNSEMETAVSELFMKHITEDTAGVYTARIKADMRLQGRRWHININESYYDDIFGGFYSAQEKAGQLLDSVDSGSLDELEKEYGTSIDDSDLNIKKAVHFVVDDIWNSTLRNIVSCINAGTDADGNDYDMDKGMKELKKLIEKKKSYDDMISGLNDDKYSKIKKSWNNMTRSMNKLTEEIEKKDPKPKDKDYKPDSSEFEKKLNSLVKLAY